MTVKLFIYIHKDWSEAWIHRFKCWIKELWSCSLLFSLLSRSFTSLFILSPFFLLLLPIPLVSLSFLIGLQKCVRVFCRLPVQEGRWRRKGKSERCRSMSRRCWQGHCLCTAGSLCPDTCSSVTYRHSGSRPSTCLLLRTLLEVQTTVCLTVWRTCQVDATPQSSKALEGSVSVLKDLHTQKKVLPTVTIFWQICEVFSFLFLHSL